ncbi:MAG: amidohydrolase family protein [Vicinamibacterales bacterium]
MICDAHCHFFSSGFFEALGRQRGGTASGALIAREAGCDDPGSPEDLADRWRDELDRHGVARAALIASLPGDEASVWRALARHPERFVGYFVVDPTRPDVTDHVEQALAHDLRVACLFPAMHGYVLSDDRVLELAGRLAQRPGTALFAHCGAFSVGIRQKLGLPSPFESKWGNPLDLQRVATRHPSLPIIVPHFGAGLFRELLMLADLCPNVVADTSSSNRWLRYHPRLSLRDVFEQALAVLGPRRILFGTDSSYFPRGWQRAIYEEQGRLLDELAVSDADRNGILADNFNRLFPPVRP